MNISSLFGWILVAVVHLLARRGAVAQTLPNALVPESWQFAGVPPVRSRVCEATLVRRGVDFVTMFDRLMSRAHAEHLREVVGGWLMRGLGLTPGEYQSVGLRAALQSLRSGRPCWGHADLYFPPAGQTAPGVLILLHGNGWNAPAASGHFAEFATQFNLILVAPSFGWGNWESPAADACLRTLLDALESRFPHLDRTRFFLAGISQGGAGVGRGGAALASRFAGLIFLSPTMQLPVLASTNFVNGWRGRPVFVAFGGRDHNVWPSSVRAATNQLSEAGVIVSMWYEPTADHFMVFARCTELTRRLESWFQTTHNSR